MSTTDNVCATVDMIMAARRGEKIEMRLISKTNVLLMIGFAFSD